MHGLMKYLKDYKKECLLGPMFKFLEVIFELLLPTILAAMINRGVAGHNVPYILKTGALMIAMAAAGYASAFICQRFAARASQGFGTTLRNAVFRHILAFPFAQIDRFGASTLTTRLTNDINQLQLLVAMMIRLMIRAPFICIGAIVMSFFLDARLALLLLLAVPLLALIIYGITRSASPLYRRYQKLLDRLAEVLRESLSGVRVIRSFGMTAREREKFETANTALRDTGLRIGNISALFNPLTSLVVNLVIVAVLWVGGIHINAGRLSQGQVIAFINYVTQILYALMVMSNLIILITKSMAAAGRVNEVLAAPVAAGPMPAEAAAGSPEPARIAFENVSFSYYKNREKALRDVSFTVREGETVGVIGGTGCGKSTLVSLLAGFYPPDEGAICLDGRNIAALPEETLRRRIAVVPQKAVLFSGTIAENIRFGRDDADEAEIRAAARTAQADEFIDTLEHGYDTRVERGGANLSGGQRQRLAIARALLMHPDILILDDASSALDYLTDSRLREAVRREARGLTMLIVSQRVGAIRGADRILVMEDGRIVGDGRHDELLRSCEAYRGICLSQLSGTEAVS